MRLRGSTAGSASLTSCEYPTRLRENHWVIQTIAAGVACANQFLVGHFEPLARYALVLIERELALAVHLVIHHQPSHVVQRRRAADRRGARAVAGLAQPMRTGCIQMHQ